uniref:uncharacterized protein LOC120333976 n=1 Tax=Styela clava TaxID=7725 RepID=UPI00193A7643|nr:uncharacterized protein LOC120333976 [Styela clava]
MRPRRKRKLTNYGEGHLHWIEESQLHRALMKSLREKSSKSRTSSEDESNCNIPSPSKMPRLSVSVSASSQQENINLKCSVSVENILHKTNMKVELEKIDHDGSKKSWLKKRVLRSQRQDEEDGDIASHAIMMHPRNSENFAETISGSNSHQTSGNQDGQSGSSSKTDSPIRAQRKFASNATPPENVRRSTRCERKIKNVQQESKHVTIPAEDKTSESNDRLPETSDFLHFLCFRNTPIPVKDCFNR